MRFIGMEVHRDFCEVAIWEAGEVRSAGRVPIGDEELELFARSLGHEDQVAMEMSGNAAIWQSRSSSRTRSRERGWRAGARRHSLRTGRPPRRHLPHPLPGLGPAGPDEPRRRSVVKDTDVAVGIEAANLALAVGRFVGSNTALRSPSLPITDSSDFALEWGSRSLEPIAEKATIASHARGR
jgi:hypothetical protein